MTVRSRWIAVAGVAAAAVVTAAVVFSLLERQGPTLWRDADAPNLGELEPTGTPFGEGPATGIGADPAPRRPTTPRAFDASAAIAHVRALEGFGPRAGGSPAEAQAAEYLRSQLAGMGLDARIEEFPLPNGSTSRNVVARIAGSSTAIVVLGAHFDSKPPSPGANDNGSGCGALLEIADILSEETVVPTVEVVFFGSEETDGGDPNGHHYGSRFRVSRMSKAELRDTAGMISIDMIGYGAGFHSRTMGRGPLALSDSLLAQASALEIPMTYLKDPGKSGWSDHEAYELAGVPVAWVQWRDDPVYHTAGDVVNHLQPRRIESAGRLVLDFMRSLEQAELQALLAR